MSKIAIISQPDQGILIDISGCIDLPEVIDHLGSSLQAYSQLPEGTKIDLKLGAILLSEEDVDQITKLATDNGVNFQQVYATNNSTKEALKSRNITLGKRTLSSTITKMAEAISEVAETTEPAKQTAVASDFGFAGPGCEASDTASSVTISKTDEATPSQAVLYLKQNLRSGQSVNHKGHLVIFGDVNPGAEVIADGDITIWGALRGVAHAGVNGNTQAEIRALRLQPIQVRIAHAIARAPDRPKSGSNLLPETARVVNGQIRIQANIPE